jgi:hypothetical protein
MRVICKRILGIAGGLALMFILPGVMPAAVAQSMDSGGLPARTYVTFRSKAAAASAVTQADVHLKEDGKPVQVTGLAPVLSDGRGIELAFVIDDSLRGNVGEQLNDVKAFFQTLPAGISVFVGYMQNGHVAPAMQGFTTDRTAAIRALRVPMSIPGGNASPYFCISDFVQRWPSRRSSKVRVLFTLTNGVDNYTGTSPLNVDSPYVDDAIRDAQKAGVLVYSLYFPDQGMGGGGASYSGQNYLSKMANETGGTTYYQGSFSPVSLAPFLKQFDGDLNRLFELKFLSPKNGLQPIRLSTDIKGVKLTAPEQVFIGEPE